jgi:type I restriction enzyme S subunit
MPEELPDGWSKTTLGEIVAPSRERASPMDHPAVRYVGLEDIEPHSMRLLDQGYGRAARSSSVRFLKGDVLYGKMRPYLNKVWVAEFDGLCSAEFLVFRKHDGLDSKFLGIRLNAEDFVSFANGQVSGERPRVDFEKLSHFEILLPPIAEQERIVAKLSVALTRVDRANAATRRAGQRLRRYHASVLQSAISGELSRDWREAQGRRSKVNAETGKDLLLRFDAEREKRMKDSWKSRQPIPIASDLPRLPERWAWATVEDAGEVRLGRQRSPQHHSGAHMRPYLRVANVFEDRIDISDVKRMNFTPREFEVYLLKEGDILLNEGQSLELVGRPAMYRNEIPDCCFQNTLIRFRAR